MTFISEPGLDKRKYAEEILGGTPSIEDVVQKVAELEYLEEIEAYKIQRAAEYPDFGSQLDYIYHNGVDSWKTNVVDPVKAKYAKVEIDDTELASRKAQALAEYQLEEYTKAMARLSQYQVALGREEVIENQPTGEHVWDEESEQMVDVMADLITVSAIEAIDATVEQTTYDEDGIATTTTIENPLITKDNEERAAAQDVINNTEQAVIDHYEANQ